MRYVCFITHSKTDVCENFTIAFSSWFLRRMEGRKGISPSFLAVGKRIGSFKWEKESENILGLTEIGDDGIDIVKSEGVHKGRNVIFLRYS